MARNISRKAAIVGIVAGAALVASLGLAGCGSDNGSADDESVITIAACTTPHSEVLNDVVAPILEEQGYTLNVLIEDDYSIPNKQLAELEVDANYFQHQPYLDSEIEQFGYDLTTITAVHYEPFGIYAGSKASLDDIAEGDSIAIPNDTTNEARALLLLQQEGLIEIDPNAGITATPNDVTSNPLNLKFVETDAEMIPHVLADVAFGCINANYALDAGLNPGADALAVEAADGAAATTYANILVVRTVDKDAEWAKALADALNSDAVRDYINENYSGAVLPTF